MLVLFQKCLKFLCPSLFPSSQVEDSSHSTSVTSGLRASSDFEILRLTSQGSNSTRSNSTLRDPREESGIGIQNLAQKRVSFDEYVEIYYIDSDKEDDKDQKKRGKKSKKDDRKKEKLKKDRGQKNSSQKYSEVGDIKIYDLGQAEEFDEDDDPNLIAGAPIKVYDPSNNAGSNRNSLNHQDPKYFANLWLSGAKPQSSFDDKSLPPILECSSQENSQENSPEISPVKSGPSIRPPSLVGQSVEEFSNLINVPYGSFFDSPNNSRSNSPSSSPSELRSVTVMGGNAELWHHEVGPVATRVNRATRS